MNLADIGLYKATIQDWGLDRAGKAKKGNLQWWARVRVTAQADNPDDEEDGFSELDNPFTRYIRLTFTDKAFDIGMKQLQTLGYDRLNFNDLDKSQSTDPFNFKGVEFVAYCDHDQYLGRTVEKWNVAKSRPKPLPANDIAFLNEKFGGRIREFNQTGDKFYDEKARETSTMRDA
jgi:hypothetical protein